MMQKSHMNLKTVIETSKNFTIEFDRELNGKEFSASGRTRLAAALLDQAHEHHKAILLLLSAGHYGSAFSLIRILFETMIRGCWLFRCATDEQVERFQSDNLGLRIANLIKDFEEFCDDEGGFLSRVKERCWSSLCSYAHGGYLQAVRRITAEEIQPAYTDEEKLEVISFANFCFFLSSIEAMYICNMPDLAEKWEQRYQSMYASS